MISRRTTRSSRPSRLRRVAAAARLVAVLAAPALAVILSASCGGDDTEPTGSTAGMGAGSPTSSSATGGGDGGNGGEGGEGGTGGNGGAGGGPPPECVTNADCANHPDGSFCRPTTGTCVECLPDDDQCDAGQYCEPVGFTCVVGCTDATDCLVGGDMLTCDVPNHACVGCLLDEHCPPGAVCLVASSICIPGCSATQGCQAGFECCESSCYDFQTDPNHCGGCDIVCGTVLSPALGCGDSVCNAAGGESCASCPGDCPCNAPPVCSGAMCGLGACNAAFADCNGDPEDGCEWNTLQDGPCLCMPGATQLCYQGAPGTQGVGACHAGLATCLPTGNGWSACLGDVYPTTEICGNGVDENCDGQLDNVVDSDGDGWTSCNGDCCELPGPGCVGPGQVNPGAFEVLGNGVDDDCDPVTDDMAMEPACSFAQSFASVTASDVAKAMDICQTTTANPPIAQKKWGLIAATQLLANGSAPNMPALLDMQNKQTAVLVDYGTGGIVPKKGATMAGISSGVLRDQLDPGYVGTSTSLTTTSQPPAAYLAQHAGALPASQGCSGTCSAGTGANDSLNIRLSIRVPTNAKGFQYDFRFTSSEYWIFQCTQYNDFYLALLQSSWLPDPMANPPQLPLPADKNIAFDAQGNAVSVNNGFFQVCVPKGCNTCTAGSAPLQSTGMQIGNVGGGTVWLTNDAPVVPGETIQLELMIFDVSDSLSDSITLLDNFRWSLETLDVVVHE